MKIRSGMEMDEVVVKYKKEEERKSKGQGSEGVFAGRVWRRILQGTRKICLAQQQRETD